jgi:hypothetical protein
VVVLAWFLFVRCGRPSGNDTNTNYNQDASLGLKRDEDNDNRTKFDQSTASELSSSPEGPQEIGTYDMERLRSPLSELP